MLLKHSSYQYLNMIHFKHCGKAVNMFTELEHVVTSLQGCCLHTGSQHNAQFLLLALETQNFSCCCIFPYFSQTPLLSSGTWIIFKMSKTYTNEQKGYQIMPLSQFFNSVISLVYRQSRFSYVSSGQTQGHRGKLCVLVGMLTGKASPVQARGHKALWGYASTAIRQTQHSHFPAVIQCL